MPTGAFRTFRFPFFAVVLPVSVLTAGCDPTMKLQVRSEPPGAKLYWNTEPLGAAPRVVVLPAESPGFPEIHIFEARKSGYEPTFYYLTSRPKASPFKQPVITIRLKPLPEGVSDTDVPEVLPYTPHNKKDRRDPRFAGGLACEVKLLRVADGRVLYQACAVDRQEQIAQCAESLAEEIKAYIPVGQKARLAVATTRNRRESEPGASLAKEMTQYLHREMSFNSPCGLARELDLNGLVSENMKDSPRILRDPDVRAELEGARYVVLSGLAETVAP
ncbi:MAG: hypothetical protein JXA11_15960 [Phycisphaerae bacterium]|nr:hypothetical protein [Phycisphaerae bacterium]